MKKEKKYLFLKLLLSLVIIGGIGYFIINILYHKENDLGFIISIIGSLLLAIFSILFVVVEITNPSKNKLKIYITSIILIVYQIFSIINAMNLFPLTEIQKVEDFSGKSLTEVIKWSEKNHITINQVYEYNDLVDEYHVINQNKKSDTLLRDIKSLTVVVSEGPNPDKEVVIPNMITWNSDKVVDFINKNHLGNVKIEFVESDKLKDTLIDQSKSGTIRRNEEINLKFSLGEEELEDIKLINLTDKPLFDGEFYLKKNLIDYEVIYEFSDTITRGSIIKTDIEIGTVLKPRGENKIKLYVSKGPKIKVPDLKKYSMVKITEWIIKNKLKLEFNDQYHDTIKRNKVISVNYKSGDFVEQKTLIKVTLSRGKLVMDRFDNVDDFKAWANKYGINYEEKYTFNDEIESGNVISYSHKTGDTIKNGDTVIVTISLGAKTTVPNVVEETKENAVRLLIKAELKYNFVYENSTKAKNTVLKQSISPHKEIAKGTTITLTLSNGKEPVNNNSNNSNKQPSQPQTKPKEPEVCKPTIKTKVYIDESLLSDQASGTCSKMKAAYPNVSFSCVYQTGTGFSSGLITNANSIDEHEFDNCTTVELIIAQN